MRNSCLLDRRPVVHRRAAALHLPSWKGSPFLGNETCKKVELSGTFGLQYFKSQGAIYGVSTRQKGSLALAMLLSKERETQVSQRKEKPGP